MGNVAGVQKGDNSAARDPSGRGTAGTGAGPGLPPGISTRGNKRKSQQAATVKKVCNFVLGANWVVHCLQNERGGSTVYSASGGLQNVEILAELRETTDFAMEELRGAELYEDLKTLVTLPELLNCRKCVSDLRFTTTKIMDVYCAMVDSVLTAVASAVRSITGTFVDKEMTTFLLLAYVKESCARMRGNVARHLATGSDTIDEEMYVRLTSTSTRFESYSRMFMVVAPSQILKKWQSIESSIPKKVALLEAAVYKSKADTTSKMASIEAEEWWTVMTKRIEDTEEIIQALIAEIRDKAQRVYKVALQEQGDEAASARGTRLSSISTAY